MPPWALAPLTIAAHSVLADPEGDVAAGVHARELPGALEDGLGRLDEIGGAADHRRRVLREAGHHLLARRACRELFAGLERRQRLAPALAQAPGPGAVPVLGHLREGLAPGAKALAPALLLGPSRLDDRHVLIDRLVDPEVLVGVEAHRFLRAPDFLLAERRAVRLGRIDRFGSGIGDVRADRDERRPLGFLARGRESGLQRVEVLGVRDMLHVPSVGLHPRAVVLAVEREGRRTVDRDAVVVVADDQLAEPEVAGDRRGLLRDALHHVAVGADHVDVVVDDRVARTVEALVEDALGDRHPDGVGDPLAERPGRDLDPGRVAELGVAGGTRTPLAKLLEVLQREVVADQMEQRVLKHAGVPGAEHEAVAVGPDGVARVGAQHALEDRVAERRQRHRRAWVAGVGLLHGVHRERPDRVDREPADGGLARARSAIARGRRVGRMARLPCGSHCCDPTQSRPADAGSRR